MPNVHILKQTVSNTACGWGGIGGQAFIDFYVVLLEYPELDLATVFIERPAYVCHIDNEFKKCLSAGQMPLWDRVTDSKLNVLWKASK